MIDPVVNCFQILYIRSLNTMHVAYERFLDMKRLQRGGKSVKSNRKIHNRYVFGAFASIAERLMNEFTEDVIARIRESELGQTK